eukprot:2520962-Prymnesium_polylepis.1
MRCRGRLRPTGLVDHDEEMLIVSATGRALRCGRANALRRGLVLGRSIGGRIGGCRYVGEEPLRSEYFVEHE